MKMKKRVAEGFAWGSIIGMLIIVIATNIDFTSSPKTNEGIPYSVWEVDTTLLEREVWDEVREIDSLYFIIRHNEHAGSFFILYEGAQEPKKKIAIYKNGKFYVNDIEHKFR